MKTSILALTSAALAFASGSAFAAAQDAIAESDVPAIAQATFNSADANGDAVLDESEFVALVAPAPEAQFQSEAAMEGDVAIETTPSAYLIAKFQDISGDDAAVSADEFQTAMAKDFDAADSDDNATLEGEEIQAFAAMQRGEPQL
ncbi:MAG: hypothetical protein AAF723_05205 [Pseudomonadota bacterium]